MKTAFFLVMITFNPGHTANVAYMGGHQSASAAHCEAIAERFNELARQAMEELTEEEFPETEYGCTTIDRPESGNVRVMDIEQLADDTDFILKAP